MLEQLDEKSQDPLCGKVAIVLMCVSVVVDGTRHWRGEGQQCAVDPLICSTADAQSSLRCRWTDCLERPL